MILPGTAAPYSSTACSIVNSSSPSSMPAITRPARGPMLSTSARCDGRDGSIVRMSATTSASSGVAGGQLISDQLKSRSSRRFSDSLKSVTNPNHVSKPSFR